MITIKNIWWPWKLVLQDGDKFCFECETRKSLVSVWTTERLMTDIVPSLIFEYIEDVK